MAWIQRWKAAVALGGLLAVLLPISPAQAWGVAVRPGFEDTALARGDDTVFAQTLPFSVRFGATTYTTVGVGMNGYIGFGTSVPQVWPNGSHARLSDLGFAAIVPFFSDVDTRPTASGQVWVGTDTVAGRPAWAVTWRDVGRFDQDATKKNTFQAIFIDRSDLGAGEFDLELNYDEMDWTMATVPTGYPRAGYTDGDTVVGGTFAISGSGSQFPYFLGGSTTRSTVQGRHAFPVRTGRPEPGMAQSLVIGPSEASVPSGGSKQFTVNGIDAEGTDFGDITYRNPDFTIAGGGECIANVCRAVQPGYHQIHVVDRDWPCCGWPDGYATMFVADPAPGQLLDHTFSATTGSTMVGAAGPLVALPRSSLSVPTVDGVLSPSCTQGQPSLVTVDYYPLGGYFYGETSHHDKMTAAGGRWSGIADIFFNTGESNDPFDGTVYVTWACGTQGYRANIGRVVLFDPAGQIQRVPIVHSAQGAPVPAARAVVTLVRIEGYNPDPFLEPGEPIPTPAPNSCRTVQTNGGTWNQPVPPTQPRTTIPQTSLNPDVNPFIATNAGLYGWFVDAPGCYAVITTLPGHGSVTSPMVGVPPDVLDLNLTLIPTVHVSITTAADPVYQPGTGVQVSGVTQPGAQVTVTASDADEQTTPVVASVGPTGAWSATINLSSLEPGTVTYRAKATDADANSVLSAPRTVGLRPPGAASATVPDAQDDGYVNIAESNSGQSVRLSLATDLAPSVTATGTVTMRASNNVTRSRSFTALSGVRTQDLTFDMSGLPDGFVAVTVNMTPTVGPPVTVPPSSSPAEGYTLDVGLPTTTITTPPNSVLIAAGGVSTSRLQGTADDAVAVGQVKVVLTNALGQSSGPHVAQLGIGQTHATWSLDDVGVIPGPYTATATSTDIAGNTGPASAPVTVMIV